MGTWVNIKLKKEAGSQAEEDLAEEGFLKRHS